jgi:hypothetical protein
MAGGLATKADTAERTIKDERRVYILLRLSPLQKRPLQLLTTPCQTPIVLGHIESALRQYGFTIQ